MQERGPRHNKEPKKPILDRIRNRISPPFPEDLNNLKDDVLSGKNDLFGEDTRNLVIDQYKGTRKTEPLLRVRRIEHGFETSYISKRDVKTGKARLEFEGVFPIDPNERLD